MGIGYTCWPFGRRRVADSARNMKILEEAVTKLRYDRIKFESDHIDLDGTRVDGCAVGTDIRIDNYGDGLNKVTLSLYTSDVEFGEGAVQNARITRVNLDGIPE